MTKKSTRPNYPMVDLSNASDETIKSVCKALAEEENRRKAKTSRTTHV